MTSLRNLKILNLPYGMPFPTIDYQKILIFDGSAYVECIKSPPPNTGMIAIPL